jgi:putative NIF3 family GTP cyclohydrolase 1 type 2
VVQRLLMLVDHVIAQALARIGLGVVSPDDLAGVMASLNATTEQLDEVVDQLVDLRARVAEFDLTERAA